jgi:hypothetical protein
MYLESLIFWSIRTFELAHGTNSPRENIPRRGPAVMAAMLLEACT